MKPTILEWIIIGWASSHTITYGDYYGDDPDNLCYVAEGILDKACGDGLRIDWGMLL